MTGGWPTADEAARARLFSPVRVGAHELTSRTWVPAMVPWRATEDGAVTDELVAWYGRLADGRPGALVVEATGVRDVPSGPLLRIGDDRFVPGLRRIVDVVRSRSAGATRVYIQLIDFLAVKRRPDPARWFGEFLRVTKAHRRSLADALGRTELLTAPEPQVRAELARAPDDLLDRVLTDRERQDLRYGYRERVSDVALPHVRELPRTLPETFARAAARARAAGFDGVELHAAHAYTLASFLSALNAREDGYGRDLAGRARLPLEVLAAVRAEVGDTTVGIRFLAEEAIPGGYGVDDAATFATAFASAGADFLSLSVGGKFEDARQPPVGEAVYPYTGPSGLACMPTTKRYGDAAVGLHLPLARRVRQAVRAAGHETPVVAAGGLHTWDAMEGALVRSDADVIAAARQSLADPDWWQKLREGRGDQIRRCERTNYCEGLDQRHKAVTCRLWDRELIAPGEPPFVQGGRRLVAPLITSDRDRRR